MSGLHYSDIVGNLSKASIAVRELRGGGIAEEGRVAVIPAAGRVIALAMSPNEQNVFWSNPLLADVELTRTNPEKLTGGLGGDRLWFAPELNFHWDGAPNWETFANYKVPKAADPGSYQFVESHQESITLKGEGELPVLGTKRRVGFEVTRRIRKVSAPFLKSDPLMHDVAYVGIETSHELSFAKTTGLGLIDLWHVLQVPAGSILVVPIRKGIKRGLSKPLSYALPGHWQHNGDHIVWRYGGKARAKFGLPAAALTGRSAVLHELTADRWCLIVRQFHVDPNARYGDHPFGIPREDQAFQAWDGYSFGEMEYHSPVLDAERGPREIVESDQLWAFTASTDVIVALAWRLIGVNVRAICVPQQ